MKRGISWLIIIIVILAIAGILMLLRSPEDSWIKDSRGVWIKHGNPASTPDYVTAQQNAITCASELYSNVTNKSGLSSQCLGTCGDYAVDIVHVPRIAEDNLIENQCSAYLTGTVKHFVEIDKNGGLVKVI